MVKNIYKKLISEKWRIKIIYFFRKLISPIYFGQKFYCNCCNKQFKKFFPKGNIPRKNAECPFCFSLERTRVLDFYLANELKLYQQKNIKLLHFAPEHGLFNKLKKIKNIEYIDADINLAYARNVIDIVDIPFPDNYFDYIICSHVLGHIPDEKKAINELFRTLKINATALIMTLLSKNNSTFEDENIKTPEARLKHYGEDNLCRLHGLDFGKRLEFAGFEVERVDYRIQLSEEVRKKSSLGNGDREVIFSCKKKVVS